MITVEMNYLSQNFTLLCHSSFIFVGGLNHVFPNYFLLFKRQKYPKERKGPSSRTRSRYLPPVRTPWLSSLQSSFFLRVADINALARLWMSHAANFSICTTTQSSCGHLWQMARGLHDKGVSSGTEATEGNA
jgi:hypothetical protein